MMIRTLGFRRHFIFKHPLFRKAETASGVEWRKSVYYLWWEFLCRHEGYKRTCELGGKGKFAKIYADFGDVHTGDFKKWWTTADRGAKLFAEPALPMDVVSLKLDDLDSIKESWNDQALLIIAVPLMLRKRLIQRRIDDLLRKHHKRKRGQREIKESRALYSIRTQFSFRSLELALSIYDYRKKHPDKKLWEIAQELQFTTSLKSDEIGKRGHQGAVDKRNTMGVAVARKLKMAEKLIAGVGRGEFPVL